MSDSAAKAFLEDAIELRDRGRNEAALIQNLVSHFRLMFPEAPAWVSHHIRHAEAMVAYENGGASKRAFVDSLVGYTSIEYERDLRRPALFKEGLGQVKQHLAGLINDGAERGRVLGVLSDTIEWRVWRVSAIAAPAGAAQLGPDDLELEEVEAIDLGKMNPGDPERLTALLETFMGREAGQRLAAGTVRDDLGFESAFAQTRLPALSELVDRAFSERPDYAGMIEKLWADFVAYIGDAAGGEFRREVYVNELYVTTLAKLLCANVIVAKALHSSDSELEAILDGRFFKSRGLDNLVEYDYFGWLDSHPYVEALVEIARDMQRGLRSYDFEAPASEDLFGELMAQLAQRSQRLLLGQEWTPPWLAEKVAANALAQLPPGTAPRFTDICCGSGAFLVAVIKRIIASHPGQGGDADITALAQSITGFDVDPLAVMLAKVNWVIAAREWLQPFDGTHHVSVPVYHADSMFAMTPIGSVVDAEDRETYSLLLHDRSVTLPAFLVSPSTRALFDALMERAYSVAMELAHGPAPAALEPAVVDDLILEATSAVATTLDADERTAVQALIEELIGALEYLEREQLNGIWAFVLRNSYRPGLLAGQFNGVITNPPWLTMSRLADNPYWDAQQAAAENFGINPAGPAFLHTELATTFLLQAVRNYLEDGAVVGCVLPDTVLNGHQHEPFRRAAYGDAPTPVPLGVTELWRVESGTFKNEAIVLFGRREPASVPATRPGRIVGPASSTATTFNTLDLLNAGIRTAWSDSDGGKESGWFGDLEFRQGADFFPRTTIFHRISPRPGGRVHLSPIDSGDAEHYLVGESKKLAGFRLSPTTVPDRLVFDVLLSKHLVPFHLHEPAKGLLPIERGPDGAWRVVAGPKLAAAPEAHAAFDEILAALAAESGTATLDEYFALLDIRHKLSTQRLQAADGQLVVYGAGGGTPAAASVPLDSLDRGRLVIDQTLYWLRVAGEDEAVYLSGLFNSDALKELIGEFQPRGAFGERHVHTLPAAVTPRFDPDESAHVAVLEATRELVDEYRAALDTDEIAPQLDPNRSLAHRRRVLRRSVLPSLDAFAAYDAACRALYGTG
jgi:hypothetical protein